MVLKLIYYINDLWCRAQLRATEILIQQLAINTEKNVSLSSLFYGKEISVTDGATELYNTPSDKVACVYSTPLFLPLAIQTTIVRFHLSSYTYLFNVTLFIDRIIPWLHTFQHEDRKVEAEFNIMYHDVRNKQYYRCFR